MKEPRSNKTEFIVDLARNGDQTAWKTLYDRYRRMLVISIEIRMQGVLQRRFDAEDVLQEAFYKAWTGLSTFEYQGEGSFRQWLRKIVYREFVNLLKAQEAQSRRAANEESGGGEAQRRLARDRAPSQIIADLDSQQHVLRRMADLPEAERECITMRIFEGKTWSEIGEVLGCTRETAKEHFDRIIGQMARAVR